MKKIVFLFLFLMVSVADTYAQCAMCRAVLETEDGGVKAEAVNDGIVYLMIFPYLLVPTALYFSYRVYKSKKVAK
ncbi:hypothetical protein GJV77_01825 [Myroides pelagicus]|uniref:Uncharacterized protein n=2 Tax=Myroides pelagicus TaxID=270914 RepID=A0A7K1GIB3_9FLAO|nr:hypothetical protein [Myroides pelagicus]